MNNSRKTLFASVLLAGTMLAPLAAQARVDVDINIGPPPPRVVAVPPPRVGYVWAPGYYVWDGPHHRHVWHDGYWVHERRGYHWRADHWDQRGDHWHRTHGGWERD
jgi:hypothetical protein